MATAAAAGSDPEAWPDGPGRAPSTAPGAHPTPAVRAVPPPSRRVAARPVPSRTSPARTSPRPADNRPARDRRAPGDQMIQQLIEGMVELRFQGFLADLPDPMIGVDRRGVIRFVNAQAERLLGLPRVDLIGRHGDAFLRELGGGPAGSHPSEWHATLADPELKAMGKVLELAALKPDGSEVPVEVTLSLVGTEDGLWVIAAIRDVTDRKEAEEAMAAKEEAIRAARDAALEASRLKSQFLATMSHEIRTPMNGVLGMAHLLLETSLDPLQRRYLLALRDSGQNLLEIINDILDFSKVEAGKLKLEAVDFDLRALIEGVVELLASSAHAKGLKLTYDVTPDVPLTAHGDPARVRQVLTNLAGNAVKFTDEGSVVIRVRSVPGGRTRFSVSDTGLGIDPSARSYLLDPFTQADASTTRRFGGTGLGLAICRQLIELMGGALDYDSEPGAGSTFWFEVPLAQSGPRADAPLEGLAAGAGGARSEPGRPGADLAATLLSPSTQGGEGSDHEPQVKLRALVVDDSGINRMVARDLLQHFGYSVDVADGGLEAVAAARAENYDLILMDCLMPRMDGFAATAEIRRVEGARHRTPIVAITALAMSGDRERCVAAGMDDYVTKPIAVDDLARVVSRFRPVGSNNN